MKQDKSLTLQLKRVRKKVRTDINTGIVGGPAPKVVDSNSNCCTIAQQAQSYAFSGKVIPCAVAACNRTV